MKCPSEWEDFRFCTTLNWLTLRPLRELNQTAGESGGPASGIQKDIGKPEEVQRGELRR